ERFLAVLDSGDLQSLLDVLAPDVVMVADGGGLVPAVRHPVEGAQRVASLLSGFAKIAPNTQARVVWLNGEPAVRVDRDGELDTAISLAFEGGRISRIYAVRNPQKLSRLEGETRLSRVEGGVR
ncbi:MAG TPA: RNA polymerase subunit sigma-24, partial [Acidimicrobiia bacterium]|nr:RNA polymerase subunit sigma-24 [Acidimicrobiia bacterium]